jgi:hypothetical protein
MCFTYKLTVATGKSISDCCIHRTVPKKMAPQPVLECEPLACNSSSEDDDDSFLPGVQDEGQTSPTSMRLYLPKPRVTVQRRATVTGASPTNKRPPVSIEQVARHAYFCK